MESIQHIKARLGAVKNIGMITRAMEVVSATKMRKAQSLAIASRPYAFAALKSLYDLLHYADDVHLSNSLLVTSRKVETTLLVLVASDRGLAGAFNASVIRRGMEFMRREGGDYRTVLVGKKLGTWAERLNLPVEMMFTDFGDYAEPSEIEPLSRLVISGFLSGKWDKVVVVSTHFKTTLNQITITRELLPMRFD